MTVTNLYMQDASTLYLKNISCFANLYQGDGATIQPSGNVTISDSWYSDGEIGGTYFSTVPMVTTSIGTVNLLSTCNTTFYGTSNVININNMGNFHLFSALYGSGTKFR